MKNNIIKSKKYKTILMACTAAIVLSIAVPSLIYAADSEAVDNTSYFYSTIWSLLPAVTAIVLALITKEVYSSLFVGIVIGGLLFSGFKFEQTVMHVFNDGFIGVLTDSFNVGIIIFLIILGVIVALMNKAGGSQAFGKWAGERIKTRTGAQIATIILGMLIFVDDYFNCLTVGSVMRPVTDKHKVSRAKLAYLIDATAAPICIIAPVSSWAAAVSGFVEGEDGLALFVSAIPYNFYALLTIVMVFGIAISNADFGPMKQYEEMAIKNGDVTGKSETVKEDTNVTADAKGTVLDLIIPILSLVVCCVIGMIYTGGFFAGVDFVTAFSQSDASVGLSIGSFFGLAITVLLYVIRNVMSFKDCMSCLSEGFKAMVPAILILTFAWTLKSMTESLGATEFVANAMTKTASGFMNFLPAMIFVTGCLLAFATGTSWGTFGILIPIVVAVFSGSNHELMTISISACMAGAVCGDHCSPISDTTIMASAGAGCEHVTHVSTQLPYAMVAALVSFFAYILAGFIQNAWIVLPIAVFMMILMILFINRKAKNYN